MSRVELLAADLAVARPVQDALALRGVPCEVSVVTAARFDFGVRRRMGTVVNLVGEHPDPAVRLLMADVLGWLGDIGASVVNGLDAFVVGSSPARQLALLEHLGLPHPPARVVPGAAAVAAALAELGLAPDEAEVLDGPPLVVRRRAGGQVTRLEFAGGRLAGDAPPALPDTVAAAAAEVLGTASIEFGGVTLAVDGGDVRWLGVDTRPGSSPAALGALAEHVRFRAGLGAAG